VTQRTVHLQVGGQPLRLRTDAEDDHVQRCVDRVHGILLRIGGSPQANHDARLWALTAMILADEVENLAADLEGAGERVLAATRRALQALDEAGRTP
jgi:cell division protein ZapA (FtsZ GTPase activity inhibitor)